MTSETIRYLQLFALTVAAVVALCGCLTFLPLGKRARRNAAFAGMVLATVDWTMTVVATLVAQTVALHVFFMAFFGILFALFFRRYLRLAVA